MSHRNAPAFAKKLGGTETHRETLGDNYVAVTYQFKKKKNAREFINIVSLYRMSRDMPQFNSDSRIRNYHITVVIKAYELTDL